MQAPVIARLALAVGLAGAAVQPALAQYRFTLDIEAGPAWQLRNDFAVPGDAGTLVRLDDQGPYLAGRVTLSWHAWERWSLRFLAAPLSTDTAFTPEADVLFQGVTFAAGEPVDVDYRFDSYRVGAYYRFPGDGPWSFRAGATLKLRDAEIALASAGQAAAKSNTGVVPLLYGGVRLKASERVAIDLDADAAAASQGRAIDGALRVEALVADNVALFVGGRLLDGGADNDEVNSFATFAYAIGGVRLSW
jgi:hypothetical protein